MDGIMKTLECPFTWDVDEKLISSFNESEEITIDVDDLNQEPLFAFIDLMATAFLQAKNSCFHQALQTIKMLDVHCWGKLDEALLNSYGVEIRVLLHAKEATKYYIYQLTDRKSEASEILKGIEDGKNFCSFTELATISGCESIVWSKFHEKAHRKVTKAAKLAITGSPNCPLWHYALGKALKHARRNDFSMNKQHSAEEQESIIRSSELSNKPFYKILLAQMYHLQEKWNQARTIYSEIYESNPKGQRVLLILAHAFTSLRDFERASLCFKKADKYPRNTTYDFYKGKFFIKTKNFKEATFHLRKAAEYGNYRADILYAWSMQKIDEDFDFIAHLKTMLEKHTKFPRYKQENLLHIAMHYDKNTDLKHTLTYLLKAIEFDPQNSLLENYVNTTINWEDLNIYDFTYEKLQQIWNWEKMSEQMRDTVKKLHDRCQEYRNRNLRDFSI